MKILACATFALVVVFGVGCALLVFHWLFDEEE